LVQTPVKAGNKAVAGKTVEPEPAPASDQSEDEFEEGEEEGAAPAEETSTEPPKKTIKPVVRPFR